MTRTRLPRVVNTIARCRPRSVRPNVKNRASVRECLRSAANTTGRLSRTCSVSACRTSWFRQFLSELPESHSNPSRPARNSSRTPISDVYDYTIQLPSEEGVVQLRHGQALDDIQADSRSGAGGCQTTRTVNGAPPVFQLGGYARANINNVEMPVRRTSFGSTSCNASPWCSCGLSAFKCRAVPNLSAVHACLSSARRCPPERTAHDRSFEGSRRKP